MNTPLNISSDDAAFFQASTSGQDNDSDDVGEESDDTEDPVGRGASKIGQKDMFVSLPKRPHIIKRGGKGEPLARVNLTKGARLIPF